MKRVFASFVLLLTVSSLAVGQQRKRVPNRTASRGELAAKYNVDRFVLDSVKSEGIEHKWEKWDK